MLRLARLSIRRPALLVQIVMRGFVAHVGERVQDAFLEQRHLRQWVELIERLPVPTAGLPARHEELLT